MLKDDESLGGRLKRYVQVSSAMGGLAARLAGERYFGVEINRDTHATDLKVILGGLKGPLMKVAQFLATIPGALPPEYANEFLELQTNAPSMGWSFVRRRMATELGPEWQANFSEFSREAAAAASLGQVHRARDLEGRALACKLQYPDMQSTIQADINQLKLILSIYESFNKALETQEIQSEITQRLQEELDYTLEAANIHRYRKIFEKDSSVCIPEVIHPLSTKRLLTMTWLEGKPILSFTQAPDQERNALAERLFKAWYVPFYHYGIIHGDPHPGNYTIASEGTLNILDFGCIRVFPPSFVQGVIDLYHALEKNDRDLAVHAYESWGFKNLNNSLIEIITQWAKLLYEPLLDDCVRPIQRELDGKHGWDMATKIHEELSQAGGIRPPREFVFMDRAAVGIGAVLMRLKAQANWYRLFNELIENFSEQAVLKRQEAINS